MYLFVCILQTITVCLFKSIVAIAMWSAKKVEIDKIFLTPTTNLLVLYININVSVQCICGMESKVGDNKID